MNVPPTLHNDYEEEFIICTVQVTTPWPADVEEEAIVSPGSTDSEWKVVSSPNTADCLLLVLANLNKSFNSIDYFIIINTI